MTMGVEISKMRHRRTNLVLETSDTDTLSSN